MHSLINIVEGCTVTHQQGVPYYPLVIVVRRLYLGKQVLGLVLPPTVHRMRTAMPTFVLVIHMGDWLKAE